MKILVSFLLFFIVSVGWSQTTDAFVYRAAVLDSAGQGRSNEKFEVAIRIQDGATPNEKLQYSERHLVTTDDLGWYQVKIGSGETPDMYNTLSDVDWNNSKKNLYIIVKELEGRVVSNSITEIVDSPALSFATNVESKALLTLNCFTNLNALREFGAPEEGDMVCVKGHSSVRDGGEGFFYYKSEMLEADDDGIIIRPKEVYNDKPGRWVRQIDGYINVNYYGVTAGPTRGSVSDKIQRAIDFVANNKYNDWNIRHGRNELTRGNTVFFPNGDYIIDKPLIIKDGVSMLGEGFNTFLTAKSGADLDYIIKTEKGRIICHIEKFVLVGNSKNSDAGGIYIQAQYDPVKGLGGMSRSKFKNIEIIDIDGHGLVLEGQNDGGKILAIDNQFNVFENLHIRRKNPLKNALLILGSATQNIFIECVFEGDRSMQPTMGSNVFFDNTNGRSAGLSFVNCGFGLSEKGIVMIGAENITLDTCWFENVFTSIEVESSKNINVLGCRFANACGYGSEPPNDIFTPGGQCVSAIDSSINIEKNYVLISKLNVQKAFEAKFINAKNTMVDSTTFMNTNTIVARENTFRDPRLSKTFGIVRSLPVNARTITLDGNLNVAANFDGNSVLRKIESSASGGEYVILKIIKPRGRGTVKIKDWDGVRRKGNISLNGEKQLVLTHGQEATFLKIDAPLSNNGEEPIYKLVSVASVAN